MKITKKFTFEAAHSIKGHDTCGKVHGHSYKLEVTVEGPVHETGMVMDFSDLKKIVQERIIDKLDHRNLDELGYFKISTAEIMSIWIWHEINIGMMQISGADIFEVKLYETVNNFVIYNGK